MSKSHFFESGLRKAWPTEAWQDVTVAVGVSGGPDSVALLTGLAALHGQGVGRLVALHFNHQLRGENSDGDEQFVVQACGRLDVECVTGRSDASTSAELRSSESALRDQRYRFLASSSERIGARYLATAHTADDQVETILHRIVRGTGIAGLAGIPPVRVLSDALTLVRPMLALWRTDVLEYLCAVGQTYRDDGSNRDLRFTRNRIRHELLPEMAAKYNASVYEAILRLGQLAGEAQRTVRSHIDSLVDDSIHREDSRIVRVACEPLCAEPPYLIREVFISVWRRQNWPRRDMGSEQWQAIAALVAGEEGAPSSSSASLPGNVLAQRVGNEVILTRSSTT
jgi:tRNA(Ile)-lysidine synthase